MEPKTENKSISNNEQQQEKEKYTSIESTAKTAKSQIEVLKNFCHLVQHYGADLGLLLEEVVTLKELDT